MGRPAQPLNKISMSTNDFLYNKLVKFEKTVYKQTEGGEALPDVEYPNPFVTYLVAVNSNSEETNLYDEWVWLPNEAAEAKFLKGQIASSGSVFNVTPPSSTLQFGYILPKIHHTEGSWEQVGCALSVSQIEALVKAALGELEEEVKEILQKSIEELDGKITKEATCRIEADGLLQGSIDEVKAAIGTQSDPASKDSTVYGYINFVKEEVENTSKDIEELKEGLAKEATCRIEADSEIYDFFNGKIAEETAAREVADATEADCRKKADAVLQENICTEATCRKTAITDEATCRAKADAGLEYRKLDVVVIRKYDTLRKQAWENGDIEPNKIYLIEKGEATEGDLLNCYEEYVTYEVPGISGVIKERIGERRAEEVNTLLVSEVERLDTRIDAEESCRKEADEEINEHLKNTDDELGRVEAKLDEEIADKEARVNTIEVALDIEHLFDELTEFESKSIRSVINHMANERIAASQAELMEGSEIGEYKGAIKKVENLIDATQERIDEVERECRDTSIKFQYLDKEEELPELDDKGWGKLPGTEEKQDLTHTIIFKYGEKQDEQGLNVFTEYAVVNRGRYYWEKIGESRVNWDEFLNEINKLKDAINTETSAREAKDEELSNDIEELKDEDTRIKADIESIHTTLGEHTTQLGELEAKDEATDKEIEDIKAKDTEQDGRITTLEGDLAQHKSDFGEFRETANERLDKAEGDISGHTDDISEIRTNLYHIVNLDVPTDYEIVNKVLGNESLANENKAKIEAIRDLSDETSNLTKSLNNVITNVANIASLRNESDYEIVKQVKENTKGIEGINERIDEQFYGSSLEHVCLTESEKIELSRGTLRYTIPSTNEVIDLISAESQNRTAAITTVKDELTIGIAKNASRIEGLCESTYSMRTELDTTADTANDNREWLGSLQEEVCSLQDEVESLQEEVHAKEITFEMWKNMSEEPLYTGKTFGITTKYKNKPIDRYFWLQEEDGVFAEYIFRTDEEHALFIAEAVGKFDIDLSRVIDERIEPVKEELEGEIVALDTKVDSEIDRVEKKLGNVNNYPVASSVTEPTVELSLTYLDQSIDEFKSDVQGEFAEVRESIREDIEPIKEAKWLIDNLTIEGKDVITVTRDSQHRHEEDPYNTYVWHIEYSGRKIEDTIGQEGITVDLTDPKMAYIYPNHSYSIEIRDPETEAKKIVHSFDNNEGEITHGLRIGFATDETGTDLLYTEQIATGDGLLNVDTAGVEIDFASTLSDGTDEDERHKVVHTVLFRQVKGEMEDDYIARDTQTLTEANVYTDETAAKTLTEAQAYTDTEVSKEATCRINAINTEAACRVNAINNEASIRKSKDEELCTFIQTEIATEQEARKQGDEDTLASAQSYTDEQDTVTLAEANAYTDEKDNELRQLITETETSIRTDFTAADNALHEEIETSLETAKDYTDDKISNIAGDGISVAEYKVSVKPDETANQISVDEKGVKLNDNVVPFTDSFDIMVNNTVMQANAPLCGAIGYTANTTKPVKYPFAGMTTGKEIVDAVDALP